MKHSNILAFPAILLLGISLPALAAQPLPWQREIPLREAAKSFFLTNRLNPTNPLPDWSCYPKGQAMTINNLKMRTTLWGTPDRVTISLMKNNVWDRRINTRGLTAPTLQEIIVGMDPLAGADAPEATQSCANGIVKLEASKGDAKASLQYVLGMTNDIYAIRGDFSGIRAPVWLRLYRSYADGHGRGTHTDMRKFECSALYVHPERDSQLWSRSPCYNEVFTTQQFVRNRADQQVMWKQLVSHWMEGGKDNARNLFGMPGMAILHGYQPPVKPDKIVHTTLTLEFCLETMAQIIRPAWDEWDYGGDLNVLRNECYPLMREMALFYAAYAKKGDDGHYHIIPSMEPEKWGWYGGLARNQDVISSLCLFRWALNRAAEAAEILGVDADLRGRWREIAANLAPYPTWDTPEGPVFCAIRGVEPAHVDADHFGEAPEYPTILSDDI